MAIETDADRLNFLDTDDFAVTATIGGSPVVGIFDNPWIGPEVGEVETSLNQPTLLVRTSDVSTVSKGDTIIINSANYTVVGIEPDGTGLTSLVLKSA